MSEFEPDTQLLDQLRQLLGDTGVRIEPHDELPHVILKPSNTEQVSGILKLCSGVGQAVIPLGGKTGLAGGHLTTGTELGLSLERMNAIEEIDSLNRTITVQAGCILQLAAEAAKDQGLLLPLDLGARGSATVGGNVATNAGGNMVIRYGMTREMVLGLEVVLADGTIVTSLNKMLKNNTGYDLKQLFIGAEGTLGVVTRVVIRLRPLPRSQNTALLAVESFTDVTTLLHYLDEQTAGTLSAFEVMWPEFYNAITRDGGNHRPPLPAGSAYYVLVETQGSDESGDARAFENVLAAAMEQGWVSDAVLTHSQAERNALWEIRDDVLELFGLGPFVIFDISVSLDKMERFVADIRSGMSAKKDPICFVFGHLGDCNLHLLLGSTDNDAFDGPALEELVYERVGHYRGSVSSEHGIGLHKREQLHRSRSESEIQLMLAMKKMLDPGNILNPNKIFSAEAVASA